MVSEVYRRLSVILFGSLAEQSSKSFKSLGPQLRGSGIHMLLKSYISIIYMNTALAYSITLVAMIALSFYMGLDPVTMVYFIMFGPVLAASLVFMITYIYPSNRYNKAKRSIENNLPFALIHMDSVASSGIPTEFMFELIGNLKEYGEVSRQSRLVVRNIKTFGMSSVAAINNVASKTPSPDLKQVLTGISSTISKGGNLPGFLSEMSDKTLFDYRLKREQYVKTLSTYADIYTAVMIAAPLLMLLVMVLMNVLSAQVFGFTMPQAIAIMTYVLMPVLNVAFLAYLHFSHPGN